MNYYKLTKIKPNNYFVTNLFQIYDKKFVLGNMVIRDNFKYELFNWAQNEGANVFYKTKVDFDE